MTQASETHSTTITLTLPDDPTENAVILAQRGDLARVHPFIYTRIADLTEVIAEALNSLAKEEVETPIICSGTFR